MLERRAPVRADHCVLSHTETRDRDARVLVTFEVTNLLFQMNDDEIFEQFLEELACLRLKGPEEGTYRIREERGLGGVID
jgi:hypothetical protein